MTRKLFLILSLFVAGLVALLLHAFHQRPLSAQSPALQILDIRAHADTVGLYEKFELTFEVTGTGATNPYFPYDPSPPRINVAVKLEQVSDANYVVFLPLVLETQTLDKWALWTGGTRLRGANIWQRIRIPDLDGDLLGEGYIGPPYAQSDFDRLAALGANYVNLSIPGLFTERPPYRLDEQAQSNLDALLEMAARADLFAVISFRTGPGRSDFTFYRDGAGVWFPPELLIETVWTEQSAQDAWVAMWRYTAARYRDNPVVAGYDLMVEPNADEVMLDLYDPADFYPRYAGTLYDWNQFYPRLVTAIREVDAQTPILVNPMGWGSVPWLPALQPVPDQKVVYAVHQYGPFQYTHQQPDDDRPYPGEFDVTWDGIPDLFDHDWLLAYLAPITAFRQRTGAPLAVNEFGVVRWAPGAADFLRDEIAFFEQNGLNHALWVWEPTYEPWYTWGDRAMFYPFGPDPQNMQEVENALMDVILASWQQTTLRPSQLP